MPDYTYTARDRSGRPVEGTIYAENSALAAGKVREMGFQPERVRAIDPARPKVGLGRLFAENFIYPAVNGVPLKELALFYRQFSTLISAGLPLYQSLMSLEGQTKNGKLKEIIRNCQLQVQAGGKLSDVFANYNWVFSELQIEMIRAAEHGGMMDRMLLRISDYLEREIALRQMISRLTLYPKIVLFVALMILGKSFFLTGLPAFSRLVLGMMGKGDYGAMEYLNDTLIFLAVLLLLVFGVVAFCRIVLFQSPTAQESYERFKMSIPGLGVVVKKFALAKFGRAFGAMYEAGMPLQVAIRVGGNASGSKVIAHATRRAWAATERGAILSQAFRETGVFPNMVIDMLHTGEQTGNVDAMMTKVAEYLEGDAETKAHMYSHIFAAAVLLLVLILVGFAVIRFYMQMAGNIQSAVGGAAGEE
jgi:type II secretory pathway component PulF